MSEDSFKQGDQVEHEDFGDLKLRIEEVLVAEDDSTIYSCSWRQNSDVMLGRFASVNILRPKTRFYGSRKMR